MYCCSELLKVTRLIFNTNGYYKRVEFAVCQNCGTPHTLVYTMRNDGKDKEKFFKGKIAVNEFKRYEDEEFLQTRLFLKSKRFLRRFS